MKVFVNSNGRKFYLKDGVWSIEYKGVELKDLAVNTRNNLPKVSVMDLLCTHTFSFYKGAFSHIENFSITDIATEFKITDEYQFVEVRNPNFFDFFTKKKMIDIENLLRFFKLSSFDRYMIGSAMYHNVPLTSDEQKILDQWNSSIVEARENFDPKYFWILEMNWRDVPKMVFVKPFKEDTWY